MDEATTIFVRKLEYESSYAQGIVWPSRLIHALVELSKTSLYVKENIMINSDWESFFNNNKEHKKQCREEDKDVDEYD